MKAATTSQLVAYAAHQIVRGADAVLDAIPKLTPGFTRPDHHRPIAEFFARVARGLPERLVYASFPRSGKTTTFEGAIAWLMFVRPGVRVAVVCCTASLAESISRRVRVLVEQLGLLLARDQRALDDWSCTNGSSLFAIGAGGALVGRGFDVIVADDLIPNLEAANSPTQRAQIESWFLSTLLGRLEPGGAVLVNAHRWAIDDLSGQLIARGWPATTLPALELITDESTWPDRWSTNQLRAKRAEVGPYAWASLYMGQPPARGGAVFTGLPTTYDPLRVHAQLSAKTSQIAIACDPAATAKTSADFSVIMTGAFTYEDGALTLSILEVWRGQVEIPDLVDLLVEKQRRYHAPVGIEAVGGFKSVAQWLRRVNPTLRVEELRATQDKFTRSIPTAAAWARGDIRWPPQAHWLQQALAEVQRFTGLGTEEHDDVPDALTMLWHMGTSVHNATINRRRLQQYARALPFG
jgi:predicted phage terminase large subunit-like protein